MTAIDDTDPAAQWMRVALHEARSAAACGEVPVGAVIVLGGKIIATGRNAPIATHDPSAHAEIVALRAAAQRLGNYRLEGCELFVTLEPCCMCAGALLHTRLQRVVFGAADPKAGAAGSVCNVFAMPQLNHHTTVQGGVMAQECAAVLQSFFQQQRARQRQLQSQSGQALRDDALRTPEHRFAELPEVALPSRYIHDLPSLAGLRLHYLDSGSPQAKQNFLLLHGPEDWSYAWKTWLQQCCAPGVRCVCPDLIGFGKSDKPKKESRHELAWHGRILMELIERLDLGPFTLIAPQAMQSLVQNLLPCTRHPRVAVQYLSPDTLNAKEISAPFPDAGHQAALRAFSALTRT